MKKVRAIHRKTKERWQKVEYAKSRRLVLIAEFRQPNRLKVRVSRPNPRLLKDYNLPPYEEKNNCIEIVVRGYLKFFLCYGINFATKARSSDIEGTLLRSSMNLVQ